MGKKSLYLAVQDALAKGYTATSDGKVFGLLGRQIGSDQGSGYITIGFRDYDGELHSPYAHRFIWLALKGDIPPGYDINHLNHIKSDNRIENLECVPHSENMQHTAREKRGGGGRGVSRKPTINALMKQSSEYQLTICELWELVVEYHRGGRLSGEDFNKLSLRISGMQQDFTIDLE